MLLRMFFVCSLRGCWGWVVVASSLGVGESATDDMTWAEDGDDPVVALGAVRDIMVEGPPAFTTAGRTVLSLLFGGCFVVAVLEEVVPYFPSCFSSLANVSDILLSATRPRPSEAPVESGLVVEAATGLLLIVFSTPS